MNREDQEVLTRTSAGTPMGELLRRYWLPVLLSAELTAGGPIRRIRRLGDDLVLARAPDGTIVALAARCPHRGASLHLGHNEPGGLRCIYHGWKLDPRGQCVEMPNEPEQNRFCAQVQTRAYASRERGGVVWLYLGAGDAPPSLPDLEWNLDARCPAYLHASERACNWVQAMEGDLDSSHIGVLHARFDAPDGPTVPGAAMPGSWARGMRMVRELGAPLLDVVDTAYGALYTARRPREDGTDYHRVHPFLFPCHTMLGGVGEPGRLSFNGKCWVPIDDTHTWMLDWHYRPGSPWSDDERAAIEHARYPFPAGEEPGPECDYGRDRGLEGTRMFFGVLSNPLQDRAVEESMGAIADRSGEHLGPADAMIIRVRKRLLAAARALRDEGVAPPGVESPRLYRVRPVGAVLPPGADWVRATQDARDAWSLQP
ncbi:Rieske 2Fe-2S domain-containing protein [Candidatus Binatia bacterium]|nr:Rieske 2Fe-2S domain-containing protein [Candidatus Binatia bacterium]